MRLIITNLLVAIIVTSSLVAQDSIPYFHAEFVSNPQDDKNIVVTGWIGGEGNKSIVFDIEKDSHKVFEIDIHRDKDISSIKINAESNRIAYYTSDFITIYNYLTFEKIQEFKLDTNIKMSSFSSDGSKYYFYNSTEKKVQIYNIDDGLLKASYELDLLNNGYKFESFNPHKDEIAFRRDSTLLFWSITNQKGTNIIPFKEEYTFYSFEDKGKMFSFYYDIEKEGKNFRVNVVGVAYTADGIIKYTRDIDYSEPTNFVFTSDMRYLLLNNELKSQDIYDLEEDTFVYNKLSVNLSKITHLYISPDLEYSIILEYGLQRCGWFDADNSSTGLRISTYNFKEKKQIRPLINKFVAFLQQAVISDDNKYAVINSGISSKSENVLVTIDEKFIKYLKVDDAKPVLFIDQSKYLGFIKYNTMKFYNVETEEFEREFDTGLQETYSGNTYYYTERGSGRIIVMKDDTINIFNYSDLSLDKTIIVSESGIGSNIKFDGKENIFGYDSNRINKYNIFDESITSHIIENVPDNFIFKSISTNGRYVLYGKYFDYQNIDYEVGIYDTQTDNFRVKDLASNSLTDRSQEFNFGLIGNLPVVWYYYVYNGTSNDYSYYAYNFDLDTISDYVFSEQGYNSNDSRSFLSNDNSYYINLNCPWDYKITQLIDPQTSVETTPTITGSVYPNPASDFIKIDMNVGAMNSNIEIYDAYGKQVMSTIYTGEDIDISKLAAGVYFVKSGNGTHKFMKM